MDWGQYSWCFILPRPRNRLMQRASLGQSQHCHVRGLLSTDSPHETDTVVPITITVRSGVILLIITQSSSPLKPGGTRVRNEECVHLRDEPLPATVIHSSGLYRGRKIERSGSPIQATAMLERPRLRLYRDNRHYDIVQSKAKHNINLKNSYQLLVIIGSTNLNGEVSIIEETDQCATKSTNKNLYCRS